MNDDRLPRLRPVAWASVVLATLAYVPALIAAPGRMPADSKLYLYLDPGRFLGDAASTFDPRQFAGWVPHQHVSYLWPSGPWFWVFDTLAVPDWIAHRLWIGSLMVAAGLGVRWCARTLGFGQVAALVAAVAYQTSPYVLPYVSRTSVMLLPWAGLGWIVALTVRATRHRGWRDAAWIALVVLTVGAVNATALAMIVPAPALWLLHAAWRGSVRWRDAALIAARVALLTVPVSLWWIAMLVIQGRWGAEVLPYSEALADVSLTANATEVWRSLGYWLFYVRDGSTATTTESLRYLSSTPAIAISYLVPILGLTGLALTRWAHRRFAMLLVVTGAVLAVGVHPIDDRSPLMRLIAGNDEGGLALALRSSTRALPMMNLGLALGLGALASAFGAARLPRLGWPAHRFAGASAIAIAIANLPALWTGAFVDPALERDQHPPQAWLDAAAELDRSGSASRVLQVPGAEFGAFDWGYTVDQPLPGLTDKPLVTRDLLPLGSPAAMDLLFALDDRIQDGVLEPSAVAPVARWLGVDTVWLANDLDQERFDTAHPELVGAQLDAAPGLSDPTGFGTAAIPSAAEPAADVHRLATPDLAVWAVPPVQLYEVEDAGRVIRAGSETVVVSGSGDGLVDAAAAGLLDGSEVVRYSASQTGRELADALGDASAVIVTDSNRAQARHWRSSQDTRGYNESDQPELALLREVASDQRLPVFVERDAEIDPSTQTVARQVGPVTATATSYGEPFRYLPERRPVMAVDGDPTTAWTVGEHADPVGELLRLRFAEPVDAIGLVQAARAGGRRITEVRMTVDGGAPVVVALDDRSLSPTGQPVEIAGGTVVDIEIVAVAGGEPFTAGAVQAVGFSEIVTGLEPTVEVVRPPYDALGGTGADTPLALSFTRWRIDPTDRWRSDPEPTLVREFDLSLPRSFTPAVEVRLDARASDAELGALLGWSVTASTRLEGSIASAGQAALDGDTSTAWIPGIGASVGATLDLPAPSSAVERIELVMPDGVSRITQIALRSGGDERQVTLETAGDDRVVGTVEPPLPAGPLQLEIVGVAASPASLVHDRRFGDLVDRPTGISEVSIDGLAPVAPIAATSGRLECVTLLAVDGTEQRFSVTLDGASTVAGTAAVAEPCGGTLELGAATHRLTGAALPGLQVDRVVLDDGATEALEDGGSAGAATVDVVESGRFDRTVAVSGCSEGCWLVLGEGFNEAWGAEVDGVSLGEPRLVDGGFNGWWLPAFEGSITVEVAWGQQGTLLLAFAISAIGIVAALLLLLVSRGERAPVEPIAPPRWAWTPVEIPAVPVVRRRHLGPVPIPTLSSPSFAARATGLVVGWAMLAALLISPQWAVWGVVAGFVVALAQRPRLAELTALASLMAVAALVIVRERRNAPAPGGGWPVVFESWHGLAMFAVVSLLVAALSSDDAATRRAVQPGERAG